MTRRKSQKEYVSILNVQGKGEYQLVEGESYVNNKHKLQTLHVTCGRITDISPRNFIAGQRCFSCSKEERLLEKRKEVYDEFASFIGENNTEEYELLPFSKVEELQKSKVLFKIKHLTCERVYDVRFYDFKRGSRCLKCRAYSSITKTHQKFLEEFKQASNNEYELLEGEKYINNRHKLKVIHKKCEHIYKIIPNNFIRGNSRCPLCKKAKNNKYLSNLTKFQTKVKELVGEEYKVIDAEGYLNSKSKVSILHTKCGHIYKIIASSFISGNRCAKCTKKKSNQRSFYKKTHQQFANEVKEITNNEYLLFNDIPYKNSQTHVKLIHTLCQHKYLVTPGNFLSGKRCPQCSSKRKRKPVKKTHEEYISEVYNLVKDEYTVVSKYVKSTVKVNIKHNKCGHIWSIAPSSFLSGTRCPKCALEETKKQKTKSTDSFKAEIYSLVHDEYKILEGEEYINNSTPIGMVHNKCGYVYKVRPGNFLCGRRCPKCAKANIGVAQRKSIETFSKQVKELGNGEYCLTRNSVYTNTDTPLELKHKSCGYIWSISPSAFIRGVRCSSCNGGIRKSHEEFLKEFERESKGEYEILEGEVYKNTHTPLKITHVKCGTEYEVAPSNFFTGKRCPKCAFTGMSKGEKIISEIFDENQVEYTQQQTFKGCEFKKLLRFDFGVYKKGKIRAVVEYNGPQHYEEIDYFGGKAALDLNIKRDNIKKAYCKEHAIPLIEIRYDEEVLPKLSTELKKVDIHI